MLRYRIQLHEAAEAEAREGFEFYLSRNPTSAENFQIRFDEAIAKLENEAQTFPVLEGRSGGCYSKRFPTRSSTGCVATRSRWAP